MKMLFDELPNIVPGKRIRGHVDGLFIAKGKGFVTSPVDGLQLTYEGIPNDTHSGLLRRSGGREPWYPRNTEMRNERQLSLVSRVELDAVAADMQIKQIAPEWIGANMTLAGIEMLSMLPPSTLLFFEGGVTLKIDQQNGPCRHAGEEIAHGLGNSGDQKIALGFPKHAKRRRGVVAWVEKQGTITIGESVTVQIPEQWIYPVVSDA